jgi:3-dehydroquinate synthase
MKIKSSIKDYNIEFSNNFKNSLLKIYNEGDIVIMDNNIDIPLKNIHLIKIDISENTKSFEYLPTLLDKILGNFNKSNKLIAVGGGITQDIVSFISSILFRGVDWVFFPTTLLAQGDSCIGGKTSINYKNYKNQLGNFNPPNTIIICDSFLETLPEIDLRSGLGEMLHFYLVSGLSDYTFFKNNTNNIRILVKRCLEIKKTFVEIDEFDKKERLILNYGHTFGHAIEASNNYTSPHGITVSLGMDIANFISYQKGYINKATFNEIHNILKSIYKDLKIPNIEKVVEALKKDKKNTNSNLTCVLTKGIGNMFLDELDYLTVKNYLKQYEKEFIHTSSSLR